MKDTRESTPPNLLRQETQALGRYILLLFKVCELNYQRELQQQMQETLTSLFKRYLHQDRVLTAEQTFLPMPATRGQPTETLSEGEARRELRSFTPIIVQCLRGILDWDEKQVQRNIQWLFPLLTALMECASRDIHAVVRRIFEVQVTKLIPVLDYEKLEML